MFTGLLLGQMVTGLLAGLDGYWLIAWVRWLLAYCLDQMVTGLLSGSDGNWFITDES